MANISVPKLPSVDNIKMLTCCSVDLSTGKNIVIKQNDLVAVQFVKGKDIIIRRGRIAEIKVSKTRGIDDKTDNLSCIVLDCSEQFTVKIIEIKFRDVVDIGEVDGEFVDYNNRATELEVSSLRDTEEPNIIPVRERGFAVTK